MYTYMEACPLRPVSLVVAVLGGGAWHRVDARVGVTPVEGHRVSAEVLHRTRSTRLAKHQSYMYRYKCKLDHGTRCIHCTYMYNMFTDTHNHDCASVNMLDV
jgi:hypothetical protein